MSSGEQSSRLPGRATTPPESSVTALCTDAIVVNEGLGTAPAAHECAAAVVGVPDVVPAAAAAATTTVAASSWTAAASRAGTGTRTAVDLAWKPVVLPVVSDTSGSTHRAASAPVCLRRDEAALLPTPASTTPSTISDGMRCPVVPSGAAARLTATTSFSAWVNLQTGDDASCEAPSMVRIETGQTADRELKALRQSRAGAQISHASHYEMQVPEGSSEVSTSPAVSSLPPASSLLTTQSGPASRPLLRDVAPSDISGVPPAICLSSTYRRRLPVHAASVSAARSPRFSRNMVYETHSDATRCLPRVARSHSTMAAQAFPSFPHATQTSASSAKLVHRPAPVLRRAGPCAKDQSCRAHVYTGPALAATASSGSDVPALAAAARGSAALTASACSVGHTPCITPQQLVCQAAAVGDAPSPQKQSSGGAGRLPALGSHHTVISLSITVINHSLETPLPGLDPIVAPFSSRRITRVPVIRVYGVINEAFSQFVPTSSQHCRRRLRDSRRSPRSSSIIAVSLDPNSSATSNVDFTDRSRRVPRRHIIRRTKSESGHDSHPTGLFSNDCSDVRSSNARSERKKDSISRNRLTNAFACESRSPGARCIWPADNACARTASHETHRPTADVFSNVASASRGVEDTLPKYYFRSLLGPPAAYSAIARKLNCQGALVESMHVLKGRSCCAVVHGVLPYFYVPLPLEAHAHPRTWLRWFCCRLADAEQQWDRQQYHAENSLRRASYSAFQQPGLIIDPGAAGDVSGKEDSVSLPQQSQQRTTNADYNNPVQKRDSFPSKHRDRNILIYDVQLVWRRSLYGYDHVSRLFAQVFTLVPGLETRRLAGLLLQGTVTGQLLQPFEVHIPFTLHFLADYKLRGMDTLIVCDPLFVAPFVLSPEQLCNEDDVLLSSTRGLIREETSSAAAATLQRHLGPGTCYSEGLKAVESQNSRACRVHAGAGGRTAGNASNSLMQPPAGVLLFTSWRNLWGRLSRAAAELAAIDRVIPSRTRRRRSNSTAPARAATADCTRLLPGALGGSLASECIFTSTCTVPFSHRCCERTCCHHKCSLAECSPSVSSVIGQDMELWPTHAKGSAAGAHVEPALLSSTNKTSDVGNTSGSNASSSSIKLHRVPNTNGRNKGTVFDISSATCTPGAADKQGTSAIRSSSRTSNAQRSSGSCSGLRCCSSSSSWKTNDNWLRGEGRRVHPLLPLSKRTTSCETELHVLGSQIMNPLFEGRGSLDSHCHSVGQTPDDGTGLPLPRQPLLAAVRDYWHEEAARAAALGLQFTPLEYPVKLTPPSTLPPAAVAALQQRQCGLAKEAIPQAYKDHLRHLLARVGVVPSEARIQRQVHGSQLSRDYQPREKHVQLHGEEGVHGQDQKDDVASERPQLLEGGFLKGESRFLEMQSGLSIAAVDGLPPHQSTQRSSRPPLSRKNRSDACEGANIGATRFTENDKGNSRWRSSLWSGVKAARMNSSGCLRCAQDALAISAEDQEGRRCDPGRSYSRSTSASRECVSREDIFLFSLSQEPPSPAGIWQASEQQTPVSTRRWRDSLHWFSCERTLSSPCTVPSTARNSGVSRPPGAGWASHTSQDGYAAVAVDTALSANEWSPVGASSAEGTTRAVGAAVDAAVATHKRSPFISVPECTGQFSSTSAQQSTQSAKEHFPVNACRDSFTAGSSDSTSVIDACRAPSPIKAKPVDPRSNVVSEKKVCTHTVSADCGIAVPQLSKNRSQSGVDEVRPLSLQDGGSDADACIITRDSAAAVAKKSEKDVLLSAYVFSDNFPQQQAYAASVEDMQSASGENGDRRPSGQEEGSETRFAPEWRQLFPASSPSGDSSEAEESRIQKHGCVHRRMKTVKRRRTRCRFARTQSTGTQKQAPGLQDRHLQTTFAQGWHSHDAHPHDAEQLEAETREQPDERRRQGKDGAVAVEAAVQKAAAGKSGAPAVGAAGAGAAAGGSVAFTVAPKVSSGAQARSSLERNVLAPEVTGDFQVVARRSLLSACKLRTFEQRGHESVDKGSGSESNFSSHASTVVLLSDENSESETSHFRQKEGTLEADQRKVDLYRKTFASSQEAEQEGRRLLLQAEETNSTVTDLPRVLDIPAIQVQAQGEKPPLSSASIPSQGGLFPTAFPVMHALKGYPRRSIPEQSQQVASSKLPSGESSRLQACPGLSHEQPQQQEQGEEQTAVRQEIGENLVVDRWPDVPVLLPFYGDPLDSPLHSQRSVVVAAKAYSRSRRLPRVQRIRDGLKCERRKATRKHTNRSPASASTEQRRMKAGYGVIPLEVRERKTREAQGNSQGQQFSQANAVVAVRSDADSTLNASRNAMLAALSRGADKHDRKQQPQLQDVQNCRKISVLQEHSADLCGLSRCCKAGSNTVNAFVESGEDVKVSDSTEPPVLGQICQTISSGDERSVKTLTVQSSAVQMYSECIVDAPPGREETPFARIVTWQFCRPPPSNNAVLATCPLSLKQRLKKQACLAQHRQQRVWKRRGIIASENSAKNTLQQYAVLPAVYIAKRGVYRGTAFACCRGTDEIKRFSRRIQRTRRKILPALVTLIVSSEPRGSHRARACKRKVLQNDTFRLGLAAVKRASYPAKYLSTSVENLVLQDTKECTASQQEEAAASSTAEAPELHRTPSSVDGGDEQIGGSTSSGESISFQPKMFASCGTSSRSSREESGAFYGEQPRSPRIPGLSHEYSALATSIHSAGIHEHSGAQVTSWRTLAGTTSGFDRGVPRDLLGLEREALTQQAAPDFNGCDAAKEKKSADAVVPIETFTPRTCAHDGPAYRDVAHRSDGVSSSEIVPSCAVSAGSAGSTPHQRPPLATVPRTDGIACASRRNRTSGGISPPECMKTPQIRLHCTAQPPMYEGSDDSSVSGVVLRSVQSGRRSAQSCTSTSSGSVEIPVRGTGVHQSVTSCTAIGTAEASEDKAAGCGGCSQLSAGVKNTWALQSAAKMTAVSAEAEADAAAAASAIMNYQGHRLLYGSLMVVEVLAERTGCSHAVPEGLGGPTPWKDAVLAVAFAVRDERLRTVCEELKKRITAAKERRLQRRQRVDDAFDVAQRHSSSRSRISCGASSQSLHDFCSSAADGGYSRVLHTVHKICRSEEKVRCKGIMPSENAASGIMEVEQQNQKFSQETLRHGRAATADVDDEGHRAQGDSGEDTSVGVSRRTELFAERQPCSELNMHVSDVLITSATGSRTVKESEIRRRGERQPENIAGANIHGLLTYHEALAVIFVDRPYVPRKIPSTAATPSAARVAGNVCFERGRKDHRNPPSAKMCAHAGRPAEILSENGDVRKAPFPCSLADFVVSWQERHPPLDAHAQLKNYIPCNTQLFAVKNEHELMRKTALFLTLVDPSIVLQWDGNVEGLGYLLRRAAVLGCDKQLYRALSRRIDTALLWRLSSKSAHSPGDVGKTFSKEGYGNRRRKYAGVDFSADQPPRERMGRSGHGRVDHLSQGESAISARIVLDCWSVLQREVKLQLSTLEGVVQEVLGITLPTIPIAILLNLWKQGQLAQRRAERQEERVMMTAWKLWERRRIRSRWPNARRPVSRQLRATVEGSEQPEQQLRRQRERMYQDEGRARNREAQMIQHLMNENSHHHGGSNALDSWPHPEKQSVDLTWGVATMGAVLKHLLERLQAILALIDHVDVLPRTAELARLYGCDFHSALSRGSQFKVESVMLRATKRLGYVFASPSQKQVTEQAAPLCVPLVLEPHSGFYWSPVLVLDFQSLYPSVMIANNICFSTSLGSVKVDPTVAPVKAFGVVNLHMPPRVFHQISLLCRRTTAQQMLGRCTMHREDAAEVPTQEAAGRYNRFSTRSSQRADTRSDRERVAAEGGCELQQVNDVSDSGINVLPNGSMFVSPTVRQGVFPRILWDLLRTRVMIKKMMNLYRDCGNERLVQLLNHRQHGLKMIANVSYGYTAASFTGHMPCAEVADAIVQAARTTLMRAIQLVENTPRWGGRVLYGDTDSLFVLVEKKSLEAAFEIGREIAYAVTQQNPPPIELQLEKVFLPCCLVSKKRYVGYAYTSPHAKPYFDAKGIESVRRDQCGCTSSVLESTLRTFFTTRDLSCVKRHLCRQWTKILRSDIPLKQFIFFRKCRLGTYKAERGAAVSGSLPAQAKVVYERLFAVVKARSLHNAHANPAVSLPGQVPSSVYLQPAVLPRGERVPFVYADTKKGSLEGLPGRRGGCRLLDFAVSPDKVKGGGRSGTWMQLFCHGAPQLVLRNILPRLLDKLRGDMAGSHLEKAHKCCSDAEIGEHVTWANDLEEAFMIREWVEGYPLQNEVPDNASHLENIRGRRSSSSAREACAFCRQALYRNKKDSTQTLSPLYLRYYIVKQIIPALERLFCLLSPPNTVDLTRWYVRMPKVRHTSPYLRRSPHRGIPRWHGTHRVRRMHLLPATPLTIVSKREVRRPDRRREVLNGSALTHSGRVAPCCLPHSLRRTRQMRNGAEGPRTPYAVWPCCVSSEWRGADTREPLATIDDSEVLGYRRANETDGFHQCASQNRLDISPRNLVQVTTRNSEWDDGNIKTQATVGLRNELKAAEKQSLEMDALCEACAGSKICGAACSHAWHCEIYFRKLRTEEKIHDVLSRIHPNLDGLERQSKRTPG